MNKTTPYLSRACENSRIFLQEEQQENLLCTLVDPVYFLPFTQFTCTKNKQKKKSTTKSNLILPCFYCFDCQGVEFGITDFGKKKWQRFFFFFFKCNNATLIPITWRAAAVGRAEMAFSPTAPSLRTPAAFYYGRLLMIKFCGGLTKKKEKNGH